jgi:hypothetical protein
MLLSSKSLAAVVILVAMAVSPRANTQTTQVAQPSATAAQSGTPSDASSQKQEIAPAPSPTAESNKTAPVQSGTNQAETEEEIRKREESQRILGVVPMFGVTNRHHPPPLTSGQKFHLFVKGTVDPFNWAAIGVQAGISQAQNSFPQYGQGAAGYGKRFGAALADSTSSGLFANFVYPVLLKEDPRYFRSGEGTIKRRIGYSLAQEFVGHKDSGGRTVNWSNILGGFSAGGLSNLYYPSNDRGFSLTMSRVGISFLYGSAGGIVSEFWPDIDRAVFHRKAAEPAPPQP